MRVTLDTNFLISATQWDNSVAHKILIKFIETGVEIFTTEEILKEFSYVLQRDFEYNEEEVNKIFEVVLVFINIVDVKDKFDVVKDDKEDNKILECAVASNSEYIITYDKHLLIFKEFRGIKIVKPEELN